MATAQEIANAERRALNLETNGPITKFNPRDMGTTNITRDAGPAGAFGPGSQYNFGGAKKSLTDQFTDTQTADIFGKTPTFGGTTPKGPQTEMDSMTQLINSLLGGGGSKGPSASDTLARDKFNYEKAVDARKSSGLSDYYTGGSYNSGFDNLLKMIEAQGAISNKGVTDAYGRATTNINEGYGVAKGLGDTGFSALNAYLQANPNNPYAGMQAQVGSAPDAMSQYLGAYGVSDTPVQGQIRADQLQAQQGAGNFQNLIDVLSGVAQQGAGSRGAESQMAQLLFNTGLGQERAGYQSQASNAQAAALAQLQQQMFQSRFGVEGDRNNLSNQLAQAVIQAGGNADGTDAAAAAKAAADAKTLDGKSNDDYEEIDRTFEGVGPDRIRITRWSNGTTTREADPDENYNLDTMDIKNKGNPNLTPQILAQLVARRRAEF